MEIGDLIKQKIISFGYEYGNTSGTYSKMNNNYEAFESKIINTELDKKEIVINEKRTIINNQLNRRLSFIPKTRIELYDLVSRFVITTNSSKPAMINNKLIHHKQSEKYYQFPVKEAIIPIDETYNLRFTKDTDAKNKDFEEVMYIRDSKDISKNKLTWILHHRLISNINSELKIIFCTRHINGEFSLINKLCPRYLKKKLFRIREKSFPNFPLMSISVFEAKKNKEFNINTSISISDERYY